MKKAIVERLKMTYRVDWFKEDGDEYPLRVFILKDEVTLALDTTGESLHKRGYRKLTGKAPVSETLAAALLPQLEMFRCHRRDPPEFDPYSMVST